MLKVLVHSQIDAVQVYSLEFAIDNATRRPGEARDKDLCPHEAGDGDGIGEDSRRRGPEVSDRVSYLG